MEQGGGIGKKFKNLLWKNVVLVALTILQKKNYEKSSKTINFENAGDQNFKLFPSNSLHYVMLYNIFLLFGGKTKYFFLSKIHKTFLFYGFWSRSSDHNSNPHPRPSSTVIQEIRLVNRNTELNLCLDPNASLVTCIGFNFCCYFGFK